MNSMDSYCKCTFLNNPISVLIDRSPVQNAIAAKKEEMSLKQVKVDIAYSRFFFSD